MKRLVLTVGCSAVAALLSACGGGSSSSTGNAALQACSPNNPWAPVGSDRSGSLGTEKSWVASYMNQAYLWYNEMPAVDPSLPAYSVDTQDGFFPSIYNYFQALKTPAITASGKRKDEFSFSYPTTLWDQYISGGSSADYGWIITYEDQAPRHMRVAFAQAGAPAALAGLQRGDVITAVNGISTDTSDSYQWSLVSQALYPADIGQTASLTVSRSGGATFNVTMVSSYVTPDPVPNVRVDVVGAKRIGYILYNSHIASSEDRLIAAINTLKAQSIDELVLDLRYNGGGYLYLASELAYMIAGPASTTGKTFEKLVYNDKRTADNAKPATPFLNTRCGLSGYDCSDGRTALPTLNLSRVAILTSEGTCSASEAIINGLRGVDVDVRLVGSSSCGKPYGFTAEDHCGISYFPIEFQGVNHKGFGDYADGFAPTCAVADDLSRALGDVHEAQYSVAVGNLLNGGCTPAVARAQPLALPDPARPSRVLRGPERESRILVGDAARR